MPSNRVHPTAVIGEGVELGTGNVVMPYAVILGPVTIGDDNWFGPHSLIGAPPQFRLGPHPPWDEPQGQFPIVIGNGNRIREFVSVAMGRVRSTTVGDRCIFMGRSNAPHDCVFDDDVTLAGGSQFSGNVTVGRGVNLGLEASVRQNLVLGALAMIGMDSTVLTDIPPFALVYGTPARVRGANRVGLEREGWDGALIDRLDEHYRRFGTEPPDFLPEGLQPDLDVFVERVRLRDGAH